MAKKSIEKRLQNPAISGDKFIFETNEDTSTITVYARIQTSLDTYSYFTAEFTTQSQAERLLPGLIRFQTRNR